MLLLGLTLLSCVSCSDDDTQPLDDAALPSSPIPPCRTTREPAIPANILQAATSNSDILKNYQNAVREGNQVQIKYWLRFATNALEEQAKKNQEDDVASMDIGSADSVN